MKRLALLFLIIAAIFSCREREDDPDDLSADIILTRSSSDYQEALQLRSFEKSDPFDLLSIVVKDDSVEITVAYSGGCKRHTFEIIWDGTLTDSDPPGTGIIILHDANGDMCEAYITETLKLSMANLADDISFDTLYVSVLNGGSTEDSASCGGWDPTVSIPDNDDSNKVSFAESDECVVKVTAARVICGAGLYGNLWLALEDKVSTGSEGYYFSKYLQPVAIDISVNGFVPVQGKKYIIGARIQEKHNYMSVPVCMAYSGPSVPVKLICIKEAE